MTRFRGGRRVRAWWAGLYSLERSRGRHKRCRKNITKFLSWKERVRGQCPFQKAGLEWPWTMCDCETVVVQLREGVSLGGSSDIMSHARRTDRLCRLRHKLWLVR